MMIQDILETLSDTEIMAIADQMYEVNVDEKKLYKQIVGKGNQGKDLDDLYNQMNSDSFRGTLPRLVSVELSSRYRKLLKAYYE